MLLNRLASFRKLSVRSSSSLSFASAVLRLFGNLCLIRRSSNFGQSSRKCSTELSVLQAVHFWWNTPGCVYMWARFVCPVLNLDNTFCSFSFDFLSIHVSVEFLIFLKCKLDSFNHSKRLFGLLALIKSFNSTCTPSTNALTAIDSCEEFGLNTNHVGCRLKRDWLY